MLKKIKRFLKWFIIIFLVIMIIVNITLISKAKSNKEEVPDFLGFTPFIMSSRSMEPKLPVNNIIVIKKIGADDIKVGDIISYKSGDIIITHRVTKITYVGDNYFYETKGDNNKVVDKKLVAYSQVQGKYLFTIPMLGNLINYVKTTRGMATVLSFVICLYILYDITAREIIKHRHKKRKYVKVS